MTSAISATLTWDTRDDYFAPNRGSRHSLFLENAGGPLGGDNYFVKATPDTAWYFPMPLSTVLVLRGTAGIIQGYGGKEVPLYEKYYVGGTRTVRGYEYGMAGPVDKNGDPQGASKMLVFNTELIFPLSREVGLRGALFLDVGKGFDNVSDITPLKMGVGLGLRWFSPFGPINIDIGFNLMPEKGEKRLCHRF